MSTAEISSPSDALAAEASPGRPFQGRRIVAAAFTGQLISSSGTFAAYGVLVVPLAEAFDASRGAVSSGAGLGLLVMGFAGPLLGRVMDRGNVRRMMLAGVALMSLGLLGVSRSTALWQAGLIYATAVSMGAAMFGPIPTVALVGNWFVRGRGLALGITVSGATVASFLAPPILAWLTETWSWRVGVACFGVGAFAIAMPILWAFAVGRPEQVGQRPDGDAEPSGAAEASAGVAIPETRDLVRQPNLWIQAVGFAFLFSSPLVMGLHLIPYAEDLGISRLHAAYFFTAVAPFSILGKIAFGALADRIEIRHAIFGVVGGLLVTWTLLISGPSYTLLLATGAVFGTAVGAIGPIHGVMLGKCFGRMAIGRVMGIGVLVGLPIIASAGPIAGFIFDATGSYVAAFQLQLAQLVLAAVILLFLRVPEIEPGTERGAAATATTSAD